MISVENLEVVQGAFALRDVSFAVPTGSYAVLMGSTGSGKTTLLEVIAGLRPTRAGRILLDGRDVTHLSPAARSLGYVPQDNTLFRTRTVDKNLSFALELRRIAAPEIERRVNETASWLKIGHLLDRYPAGLSGGETQRVALGRALIFQPSLLLLDEPLSALDDETRGQMVETLQALRARRNVTVLHITHNRAEAESLADVLFRIAKGRVVEIPPPFSAEPKAIAESVQFRADSPPSNLPPRIDSV
jgi:ABC-type sugar transport system ATPase subunit